MTRSIRGRRVPLRRDGDLTVLVNAGPWLPVPPPGYGGIEHVVATLVPALRRKGIRVVLATVGDSTLAADGRVWCHPHGRFADLDGPYPAVVGIAHAHLQSVVDGLEGVDLVHDHTEVVGPSVLGALGAEAPPVLHTLHWDVRKHPEFYGRFDGRGRVWVNGVSASQLHQAPAALRGHSLGPVHLGVRPGDYPVEVDKGAHHVALGRLCALKGTAIAARVCREAGEELVIAGPVGGVDDPDVLAERLADPASPLHLRPDVRYFMEEVRPQLGGTVRWVGSVGGARKLTLLSRARSLVLPLQWEEPGGTVVVEALACGTPVVGLRRGVLPELVEHGVTGFLADDADELAGYLQRVGELDPRACRRAVETRFSDDRMADGHIAHYVEVLRRAAGAQALVAVDGSAGGQPADG